MVRLIDGTPLNPIIVILGWIISFSIIAIVLSRTEKFDNDELAEYATLGAVIFFVQSVIIPVSIVFGLFFTLSGVPFVIMVKGVRKGLLISTAAIILNHIFIPGAFSRLGINLANMLLAGMVAGMIPSLVYNRMGRRVRYISGFLGGLAYYVIISVLITIEIALSTENLTLSNVFYFLVLAVIVMGLIEGFLTAITSSYFHRMKNPLEKELTDAEKEEDEDDDDEIEPIYFFDE